MKIPILEMCPQNNTFTIIHGLAKVKKVNKNMYNIMMAQLPLWIKLKSVTNAD